MTYENPNQVSLIVLPTYEKKFLQKFDPIFKFHFQKIWIEKQFQKFSQFFLDLVKKIFTKTKLSLKTSFQKIWNILKNQKFFRITKYPGSLYKKAAIRYASRAILERFFPYVPRWVNAIVNCGFLLIEAQQKITIWSILYLLIPYFTSWCCGQYLAYKFIRNFLSLSFWVSDFIPRTWVGSYLYGILLQQLFYLDRNSFTHERMPYRKTLWEKILMYLVSGSIYFTEEERHYFYPAFYFMDMYNKIKSPYIGGSFNGKRGNFHPCLKYPSMDLPDCFKDKD
jgi:hypothetical protein